MNDNNPSVSQLSLLGKNETLNKRMKVFRRDTPISPLPPYPAPLDLRKLQKRYTAAVGIFTNLKNASSSANPRGRLKGKMNEVLQFHTGKSVPLLTHYINTRYHNAKGRITCRVSQVHFVCKCLHFILKSLSLLVKCLLFQACPCSSRLVTQNIHTKIVRYLISTFETIYTTRYMLYLLQDTILHVFCVVFICNLVL